MYIKKFLYGGLDYHDAEEAISQLEWDGKFNIPEDSVEACILADIMACFPYADSRKVQVALRGEETYRFPLPSTEDGTVASSNGLGKQSPDWVEIFGYKVSEYYISGQAFYETSFSIEDIRLENVCYIPEEQFYAIYKGIPLIERFYHEPFCWYREASSFMETMEKHDPKSELVILVHDRSKIVESNWYKDNMKVVEELRSHPEKRDWFAIPVKIHLERLGVKTGVGSENRHTSQQNLSRTCGRPL